MIGIITRIKPLNSDIIYERITYSILFELWMLAYKTYEDRRLYLQLYGININCPTKAAFNSSNT